MTEPKYKPIPFTAPMVRAILEGRKTQTRRIVKVQPPGEGYTLSTLIDTTGPRRNIGKHHWLKNDGFKVIDGSQPYFSAPYAVGDRLWVKESFRTIHDEDNLWDCIEYADGQKIKPNVPNDVGFKFSFDCDYDNVRWRSSRFMPRWASRITLEVTGVRVERLQDISEDDAVAEGGGEECPIGHIPSYRKNPHKYCFDYVWNSIHGHGSWEKNPWVWVVEFKRVEEK